MFNELICSGKAISSFCSGLVATNPRVDSLYAIQHDNWKALEQLGPYQNIRHELVILYNDSLKQARIVVGILV